MKSYDHKKIEKKWQKEWDHSGIYEAEEKSSKKKFYPLVEFPFPSGAGLHVGHIRSYTGMDIIARKHRMDGENVLYPIGWDAFGLPTENYAIKTGVQPKVVTKENNDNFRKQLKSVGLSFDWSREINTTDPNYYKWTQWIFLKLYEKGLAYKAGMTINWCPKDKIGLANEEVIDGRCERCGILVEKKFKEQWMLKITDYADRLLRDLDAVESKVPLFKRTIGTDAVKNDRPFEERTAVVSIIKHWSEDKYLCSEWKANDWRGFIIGGVEKGEDYSAAALREIKEETGYTNAKYIKTVGKADAQFFQALKNVNRFAHFTCVYVELANGDREEMTEEEKAIHNLSWLSREEMEKALNRDDMKYFWDLFVGAKKQESKSLLDWTESIKEGQRNWIGRSEGMLFTAPVKDTSLKIQTFSAHFEAFAADTFVVIAPDHPFLKELVKGTPTEKKVLAFAQLITNNRSVSDYGEVKEPEGIFTGRYIIDPVGNGDLPIWVANYALADYGTGIVKCSCHDERDFAFAKKYNLKLKPVLFPADAELRKKVEALEVCYFDMKNGILSEPKEFSGKKGADCRKDIIAYLEKNKLAEKKTTYKLKDWVFSRQRYWGEPIPMIHCEKCGWIPVPEKDLPVKLPEVKKYEPTDTGESPLSAITKWVNVKCPVCKGKAKRETDTMPNWAGSSWYYLRYLDPKNKKEFASQEKIKHWMPVDWYNGGMEHTTLHLLYSRFWHKVLYDLKLVNTNEPYQKRTSQGIILAEDGEKMSKSRGNVVNPNDIVETYGADTLRVYEMFIGPFSEQVKWNTDSIIGSRRFIERLVNYIDTWLKNKKDDIKDQEFYSLTKKNGAINSETDSLLQKTIKKVTEDIEKMSFNTAISTLMIFFNHIRKDQETFTKTGNKIFSSETTPIPGYQLTQFLKLLAPFAPHITEEIWRELGNKNSIHTSEWPKWDEALIKDSSVKIAVQINGKVRAVIEMPIDATEEDVKKQALSEASIQKWLTGNPPKKIIYVKNKVINIIVNA